jgi:hypothetical protein
MSQEAVTQYDLLIEKILLLRKSRDPSHDVWERMTKPEQDEEYKFTCDAEDMWNQMTETEQKQVEAKWSRPTLVPGA